MFAALGVAILTDLPLERNTAKPEKLRPVSMYQGRRSLLIASTQVLRFRDTPSLVLRYALAQTV
jgi:hypothetical protein